MTYTLVDKINNPFKIEGNLLKLKSPLDYETKNAYKVVLKFFVKLFFEQHLVEKKLLRKITNYKHKIFILNDSLQRLLLWSLTENLLPKEV